MNLDYWRKKIKGYCICCVQYGMSFTLQIAVEHSSGFYISHSILQSGDRLLFILCTTTLILSVLLERRTVISLSYSFTEFLLLSHLTNDTVLQKSSRRLDLSSSQSNIYRNPLSKKEWYKRGKLVFFLVPEHCKG